MNRAAADGIAPLTEAFAEARPGMRLLCTGAAAAARGALEAGFGYAATYPGSPVVETFEALQAAAPGRCRIALNEHVAWHGAFGYALCGGRALLVMKQVGFHVAGDPAHYSAYLGVKGGLVAVIGDDPGATCSTGEFDVRFQSLHTHLPVLEPADAAECLSLTRAAFDLSERLALPALVVIPAGLCHGTGTAVTGPLLPPREELAFAKDPGLTSVGGRAVELHRILLEKIRALARGETALPFPVAEFLPGDGPDLVVAPSVQRAAAREYLNEAGLTGRVSLFSPRMTYPFPARAFDEALRESGAKRILFLEPLEGFLEHQAALHLARRGGTLPELHGKDLLPAHGEPAVARLRGAMETFFDKKLISNFVNSVGGLCPPHLPPPSWTARDRSAYHAASRHARRSRKADGLWKPIYFEENRGLGPTAPVGCRGETPADEIPDTPPREGTFCPGCPHRAFFHLLKGALRPGDVLGGDIGCSSLPPHHADWLTCMNSGASIAAGVARAVGRTRQRVVSLIGDSTLFHSGLQTVLECAQTDSDQILFVLDNRSTAMTGHQPTPATEGEGLDGRRGDARVRIREVLASLGVRELHTLDPARITRGRALVRRLLDRPPGFACVIVERECRLAQARREKGARRDDGSRTTYEVVPDRCRACRVCYADLACPAITADSEGRAAIDPTLCVACGLCHDACPNGAIVKFAWRKTEADGKHAGCPPHASAPEGERTSGPPRIPPHPPCDPHAIRSLAVTGLGGQGILFAARLLRLALGRRHAHLAGSDNRGGAQRFGHVGALIRAAAGGEAAPAAECPDGSLQALLAFEASEALRFLRKAGQGTLVLLDRYVLVPTNARRAGTPHPDAEEVARAFRARGATVLLDDYRALALDATGEARDANLFMIGRLLRHTAPWLLPEDLAAVAPDAAGRILAGYRDGAPEREGSR